MRRRLSIYIACSAMFMTSCHSDPRARSVTVTGTVAVNGQPVESGEIVLYPEDGSLGADSGRITRGEFTFLASAGRKRVEVRASREIPPPPPGTADPTYEELVPLRYNKEQTLWVDVIPRGENQFDIAIDGKMVKNSR